MLVLNLIGREDGMSFCDQTVEMLQSTLQVTYLKDKKKNTSLLIQTTHLNLPLQCARQVLSHFLWPVSGQVQNCLNHVPENEMSCMRN